MVPVNGLNNKFIYLSNMDPGTHWKLWNIKQEKKLGNQWSDDSLTSFPISLENILLSVNPSEPEGMLLSISLNLNNKTFIKNHRPPPLTTPSSINKIFPSEFYNPGSSPAVSSCSVKISGNSSKFSDPALHLLAKSGDSTTIRAFSLSN